MWELLRDWESSETPYRLEEPSVELTFIETMKFYTRISVKSPIGNFRTTTRSVIEIGFEQSEKRELRKYTKRVNEYCRQVKY